MQRKTKHEEVIEPEDDPYSHVDEDEKDINDDAPDSGEEEDEENGDTPPEH